MGCPQEKRERDTVGAGSLLRDPSLPMLDRQARPVRFTVRRTDRKLISVQTRVRQLLARSVWASPVGAVHVGRSSPPAVVAAVHMGRPSSRDLNVPSEPCAGDRDLNPGDSAPDPRPRCSRQDHDRQLPAGEALPAADAPIRRDRETAAVRLGLVGRFPVAPARPSPLEGCL